MAVLEEWSWIPTTVDVSNEPAVTQIRYGDGYVSRIPQGINTNLARYSVAIKDAEASIVEEIREFLEARNAVERFRFVAPSGKTVEVVCPKWQAAYHEDLADLSCEFYEVNEP